MEQCFSLSHRARHQSSNLRSLDPTFTLFNVDTNENEHIIERSRERRRLIYEEQAQDQLAEAETEHVDGSSDEVL
jgi:hypothetical protein